MFFFFFNITPISKRWQLRIIRNIISKQIDKNHLLSNLYVKSIIDTKKQFLPKYFYKFYAPTIENISDVQNQLLWLASPEQFNDPYDCRLNINEENVMKHVILESLKDVSLFTDEEMDELHKASISEKDFYGDGFKSVYKKLKEKHDKDKNFNKFDSELYRKKQTLRKFLNNSVSERYRIACFSSYKWDNIKFEQLMWAHYAQSHKGFCVKYDISPLFDNKIKDEDLFPMYNIGNRPEHLLPSELRLSLMNGLFPVFYTSERVEIPKSLCYSIVTESCNTEQKHEITNKILRAAITKTTPWQYEQEWRFIIDKSVCDKIDNKVPFPFAKEIIVGVNASIELKRILKDLAEKLNIPYRSEEL